MIRPEGAKSLDFDHKSFRVALCFMGAFILTCAMVAGMIIYKFSSVGVTWENHWTIYMLIFAFFALLLSVAITALENDIREGKFWK